MRCSLLWHTVRHLRPRQIGYQLAYRLHRPKYAERRCPAGVGADCIPPVAKPVCHEGETFRFLDIRSPFVSWNDTRHGMLWAYNLNYMDWLCQEGMDAATGAEWMDRFVDALPGNKVGLAPYPTALRGLNWIKFIVRHGKDLEPERVARWNGSLYSQYALLARSLEYHLLGNHLLEDAFSLYIAALYFGDRGFYRKAVPLLRRELAEQVTADGSHYEQSPMYHCILLDRLLDGYNFSVHTPRFGGQDRMTDCLKWTAKRMMGHLESIVYADGDLPLLNDTAEGIAPTAAQLRDYARRLGLSWQPLALGSCGYRKWNAGGLELVMDVGGMAASYQPGHSHADTFSYELRLNGQPIIVDTGISTYDKTPRRQYERSTAAHNTVVVDGKDSSEVWGGFRVGRRARVSILKEEDFRLTARHTGTGGGRWHQRTFELTEKALTVTDRIGDGHEGESYVHLAPGITIQAQNGAEIRTSRFCLTAEGATRVEIIRERVSTHYNGFEETIAIKMNYRRNLQYKLLF